MIELEEKENIENVLSDSNGGAAPDDDVVKRDFIDKRNETIAKLVEAVRYANPSPISFSVTIDGRGDKQESARAIADAVSSLEKEIHEKTGKEIWCSVSCFNHDDTPGVITLAVLLMVAVALKQ